MPPARKAFLMGQENYLGVHSGGFSALQFSREDVEGLGTILQEMCQFEVTSMFDYQKNHFETLKERIFPQSLAGGQDGAIFLFYYSGHGLNVNGQTFLVPTDASPGDPGSWISLNRFFRDVRDLCGGPPLVQEETAEWCSARQAPGTLILIFLDCCRETPSEELQQRVSREEMTRAEKFHRVDTKICYVYACDEGWRAAENPRFRHGNFTKALIEAILDFPGSTFVELWNEWQNICVRESRQRPWLYDSSRMLHGLVLHQPPDPPQQQGQPRPQQVPVPHAAAGDDLQPAIRPTPAFRAAARRAAAVQRRWLAKKKRKLLLRLHTILALTNIVHVGWISQVVVHGILRYPSIDDPLHWVPSGLLMFDMLTQAMAMIFGNVRYKRRQFVCNINLTILEIAKMIFGCLTLAAIELLPHWETDVSLVGGTVSVWAFGMCCCIALMVHSFAWCDVLSRPVSHFISEAYRYDDQFP